MTHKPFDVFLDKIDEEAKGLDRRSYNPRRGEIKEHLSDLLYDVNIDAGKEFSEEIISILQQERVPSSSEVWRISYRMQKEHSKPAGDQGGKYSLYPDQSKTEDR